ncbi:GntR family transcriptional regulator [Sinosporangium siamense]|uniref:GntR family transcriptional regulator n=1 Tax=Sinosporangium siamense TaxID=1367973 RepID=A0A919R9G5_9ACTN|nr:GntR family transcriptional regulator [Sinosporangium siamense]GII89856.1 GntR family transcriptional regulator [Sinosporangium siamense]
MASSDPIYLRIVEDIRRQINDGTLPPGAAIPSRAQLTRKYGIGETAARHALRVLASEGLIFGLIGSGHYVSEKPERTALHRLRFHEHQPPFTVDLQAQGRRATCDWRSEHTSAGPDIAQRLRVEDHTRVTRTRYVFRTDGAPAQLATSYERTEYTDGHPMPAEGNENGRKSLLVRLSLLGIKITEVVESVYTRVAQPVERDSLDLPAGAHVLHIERTHWAGDSPVETSDIVVPGDRFRLVYTATAPSVG